MGPITFAYYCSGHGYGHATRVSAFAVHLRSLQLEPPPSVHIVSSAPEHIFSDSLQLGVCYRFAEIDPVIVQPLAYQIDRQMSLEALQKFLSQKDKKVSEEVAWIKEMEINCVLSDAAFLGCLAANVAKVPSVLITNFTFDSVYSYLCTEPTDVPQSPLLSRYGHDSRGGMSELPLLPETVQHLVEQIHSGYRCADLLLLLPGSIPIPSFTSIPALPSSDWIDPVNNSLRPEVLVGVTTGMGLPSSTLLPSTPFVFSTPERFRTIRPRQIIRAPLIVRQPSPDIYDTLGRKRLLESIGVPDSLHGSDNKILIVSFGGQIFRKPRSQGNSRAISRAASPSMDGRVANAPEPFHLDSYSRNGKSKGDNHQVFTDSNGLQRLNRPTGIESDLSPSLPQRIATPSHLWVPGAPPACKPLSPSLASDPQLSKITVSPPTPCLEKAEPNDMNTDAATLPRLLPDSSWIAIVCGVSSQWGQDDGEELPDGFFIAPKDVYMPDLTAVGDVLLGKLGYGTVSECVDASTPFVFVPRPLFIEEHGLRLLLQSEGVGVELSRQKYEAGEWSSSVEDAWRLGRHAKEKKRRVGYTNKRREEGLQMAHNLVQWVQKWEATQAIRPP